jgi:DNA replication protein DnaC
MEPQVSEAEVLELCHQLKLPTVGREAVRLATEAARQQVTPLAYLVNVLTLELTEREERRAARRIKAAGFPLPKTLESFDFQRAPQLPEARLRALATGTYLATAEPILFLGESGTGKTHLATALGMAAATQGYAVRFVTAAQLVTELIEARDAHDLNRLVGRYSRVAVLILDELGYLPLARADADLLFRVLSDRHERRPVIVTTNLPFSEWTTVFPDARLCRAVVDRLTHRAHIIETGTHSIRLADTLARADKGRRSPRDPPPVPKSSLAPS